MYPGIESEDPQVFAKHLKSLSLSQIASLIYYTWDNVWFGAKPYLEAMSTLNSIDENYGLDSGQSIVLYFLGNAAQWRGEIAKAVKKELKRRAGVK